MTGRLCGSGWCDRPAVAAVYPRVGGSVLIRVDHLQQVRVAADWRCVDCLHDAVDGALGLLSAEPGAAQ